MNPFEIPYYIQLRHGIEANNHLNPQNGHEYWMVYKELDAKILKLCFLIVCYTAINNRRFIIIFRTIINILIENSYFR